MNKKGECPVCGAKVEIDEFLEVGDTTYCSECDVELNIVSLTPVKLSMEEESDGFADEEVDDYYEDEEN